MVSRSWQVPKLWEGGDVWILGGGPSLIDSFNIPNDVVQDVRSRNKGIDAYSPYLAELHSKHVIGINVAYQFGDWVDICFFGDKGFFLQHRAALSKFRKLVVTCCQKVGRQNLKWVKYLPMQKEHGKWRQGISTSPNEVCWNENSGAAAISLATWLGAKRIILVGFDMSLNETNTEQHFHNEYRKKGSKIEPKKLPFQMHSRGWGSVKSDADAMGIEIINTSLNSAITQFPKVDIKELL